MLIFVSRKHFKILKYSVKAEEAPYYLTGLQDTLKTQKHGISNTLKCYLGFLGTQFH